jgi:hypothetical protein
MEMDAGKQEMTFFTTLLRHNEESIRYRAVKLIRRISPAWSTVVIRHIKDNPSFTHILSSLEKEAV